MKTVVELFRRLEQRGIAYAVLRNYENLPDLRVPGRDKCTDIDLVVAAEQLPEFRKLLASLAEELGWDALTECDHFARSQSRHHNIEIFRFYRMSPPEFIQIDVFHGFVSWGLPLMHEADLLSDRIFDAQRGLTRIHPLRENTYRLVQLHKLGHSDRVAEKIDRYRAKVLVALRQRPEYRGLVRRYLGFPGLAAIRALERNDEKRFSNIMLFAKTWFAIRFTLGHPWQTIQFVSQRILDHFSRFRNHQCGTLVKVHADTVEARERFFASMDSLTRLNAFAAWLEKSAAGIGFTRRERSVMERGGMVFQWTSQEDADLLFRRGESVESIAAKLIGRAIDRHALLQSGTLMGVRG